MESLSKEADQYFRLLFSFENPIYYSVLFVVLLFILLFFVFKYVVTPLQKKFLFETQALELKNARLMALFAELDPDPVVRTDLFGKIIYTNDTARQLVREENLLGKHINEILPQINFPIIDSINNDESKNLFMEIKSKSYSILFRGISSLQIAQVYFHDITDKIENEKQLRTLSNNLQIMIEDERQRIARELHDGIGQELLLLKMNLLKNYKDILERSGMSGKLEETVSSLQKIIAELKLILFDLKPPALEEMGLGTALVTLINKISQESCIKGSLDIIGMDERLDGKLEMTLFRIVQESLNNIIKHSLAKEFSIQLVKRKGNVKILISDDGIGIPENKGNGGFGLLNIRERVEAKKGSFKIDSSINQGTLLIIEIPLEQKE